LLITLIKIKTNKKGTPAMTTRGLKEDDMVKIASFLDIVVKLAIKIEKLAVLENHNKNKKLFTEMINNRDKTTKKITITNTINLKDFLIIAETNNEINKEINKIKQNVKDFVTEFPLPGIKPVG
jgi:glycine/serine hydroxymethyltransferase